MSQSKSLTIPFIIVAVLLFGGALAWKIFFKEELVKVKPQPVVVKKAAAKVLKPIEKPEPVEEEWVPLTKEEQEAGMKKARNLMQLSMRYKTPESVLKAIEYHQERNEHEDVDELIEFLVKRFPNYQLPKSLGK